MSDQDEPIRLPGLYRAWEIWQLLEPGAEYRIEPAGLTEDGAALIAVFCRRAADTHEAS